MGRFDRDQLRHIVDIDGQLVGFAAERVTPTEMLLRVGRTGRSVFRLVGGIEIPLTGEEPVRLSEDQVGFFVTRTTHAGRFRLMERAA